MSCSPFALNQVQFVFFVTGSVKSIVLTRLWLAIPLTRLMIMMTYPPSRISATPPITIAINMTSPSSISTEDLTKIMLSLSGTSTPIQKGTIRRSSSSIYLFPPAAKGFLSNNPLKSISTELSLSILRNCP